MNSKVAFCGTRGVPANYGGFETAVDEISLRLIQWGYKCEIFCRKSHHTGYETIHAGRSLVYVGGSIYPKFETVISSIQTGLYLFRHRHEYLHVFWFNNANLPGILISRLAGLPITVNTDGLEWRRKKWGLPFKFYSIFSSILVSKLSPRLISDSKAIQEYYRKHFHADSMYIPYGAPTASVPDMSEQERILKEYNLTPGRYLLQITRIEPDNLPLEVAQGFIDSDLSKNGFEYAVVGLKEDTPYTRNLKQLDGVGGIRVFSSVYDAEVVMTLLLNCYGYVHGNSVGGTNPALLQAMAASPRILAVNTEFCREMLGDCGHYFNVSSIVEALKPFILSEDNRNQIFQRVTSLYQWDAVAQAYAKVIDNQSPDYLTE